jgi:hypothetical protein
VRDDERFDCPLHCSNRRNDRRSLRNMRRHLMSGISNKSEPQKSRQWRGEKRQLNPKIPFHDYPLEEIKALSLE